MAVEFQFDFDSALAAITFIASRNVPELTKYKLCKLLFLADKNHLVRYGRVITGDVYCALPHGPIPSHVLTILNSVIEGTVTAESQRLGAAVELDRQYVNPRFHARAVANELFLSESDISALNRTIAEYGRMGFSELKAITHEMFAYQQAWDTKAEGIKMAEMNFELFFEEDSDAVVGAREIMLENDAVRKVFPDR